MSSDCEYKISRGETQGNITPSNYRIVTDILIVELCQGTRRWSTSFPPLLPLIVSESDNSRSSRLRLGFFVFSLLFPIPFPSFSPFFLRPSQPRKTLNAF